jgi:uncharacterized cupin superfamily protein
LQHETGTLTVFSFDAGQALSEHTAPFHAFVQVLDGETQIIIGGTPVTVSAGEIILMTGGFPHEVKASKCYLPSSEAPRQPIASSRKADDQTTSSRACSTQKSC